MASFSTFQQQSPAPQNPQQGGIGNFLNKTFVQPVKQAFQGGIQQATQAGKAVDSDISSQFGNSPANPLKTIGDTLHLAGGVAGTIGSPLAAVFNPGNVTSNAMNGISDTISNSPLVQKFAGTDVGKATAGVAQSVGDTANVVGTAAAFEGAGNTIGKISDLVTDHPIFKPGGGNVTTAQSALNTAGQQAAAAIGDISDSAKSVQSEAGQKFAQAGAQIDQTGTTVTLTPDQLDRLNQLKTSGKFALPDAFSQKTNPLLGAPQTPGEIENPGTQFTGSQMQDLIHQLNSSTFTDKISGLGVDQGKVGLTNEIKDVAQQTFGNVKDAQGNPIWQKAYSDYARTRGALDSMSDIISSKRNLTATDLQSKIGAIQKLASTVSGKVLLQNAISDFQNVTGVDLTDPVQAVQSLVEKELALEKAQKGNYLQQFAKGGISPGRLGGGLMRIAIMYPMIRAIQKAVSGQ